MRKYELDIVRIYASFLVIVSHLVCCVVFDLSYSQWNVANVLYVARNACVPLFLSLTGILLLGRDLSPYKILHQVLYYAGIFVLGSTLFYAWRNDSLFSLSGLVGSILPGMRDPSYLWYLQELLGIYLLLPVLSKIAQDKRLSSYYLAVWFFFMFFIQNALTLLPFLKSDAGEKIALFLLSFRVKEFITYAGYLIFGHYIYNYMERKISWKVLLLLMFAAIAVPALANQFYVAKNGAYISSVWEYWSFSALIQTGCYLLFAKEYLSRRVNSNRSAGGLKMISSSTFGIYLIHPYFAVTFYPKVREGNLWFRVPVLAVLTFALSLLIVVSLRIILKRICGILQRKNGFTG